MSHGLVYDIKKEWGNYVLHNFPICVKELKTNSVQIKKIQINICDLQKSADSWDIYDFKHHC